MGRTKQREIDDVSIWFDTGTDKQAKTDSDIFIKFYNAGGELIGWLEAYERSDLQAFESGMLNYGDLGNPRSHHWLLQLKEEVAKISIEIDNVTEDMPDWYPEHIALDFCQDTDNERSLIYMWNIGKWIREEEHVEFEVDERFEGDVRSRFSQHSWRTVDIHAGGAEERPDT